MPRPDLEKALAKVLQGQLLELQIERYAHFRGWPQWDLATQLQFVFELRWRESRQLIEQGRAPWGNPYDEIPF